MPCLCMCACIHIHKSGGRERDTEIGEQKQDLVNARKNMELYSNEVNFNLFYDNKRKEIKQL